MTCCNPPPTRLRVAAVGLLTLAASTVIAQPDASPPVPGCPWPATDALGRVLPTSATVGPARSDRFVGIFYFLWHQHAHGRRPDGGGPYDVSRILAEDPDAVRKPNSPLWGPIGMYHYWSEPLYGYYQSTDPWVLRRHAYLLADAGIDTLIFDTTNALTYPEVYRALCEVLRQIRRDGDPTPSIAFMVNTKAGETAQKLFKELYQPGLYAELWFRWQGKPLLICDPAQASAELRAFFTLRRAHWPFELVNTAYAWHWEATYPQPYGFTDDPNRPEQVNVSVAQNLRQADGTVTHMSNGDARGRGFHDGHQDSSLEALLRGRNFEEQWQRAHQLAPPFVMVTGWNEWIAGRWGEPNGPIVFVDQYDQQFSRDIEPMRGGHGDNYYYQMVANIRQFKGAPSLPSPARPRSIRLRDSFDQWQEVEPTFMDHVGEVIPRDHAGAAGLHYTDRSGRRDLVLAKVAHGRRDLSFYLQWREPIVGTNSLAGLWLLIDIDQDRSTGWEGYDFIINRIPHRPDQLAVERNTGGWRWAPLAWVPYRADANELQLTLPRSVLGLSRRAAAVRLDFKWVDNAQDPGNLMDFYVSGDAAPEGRFNYRYLGE